MNYYKTNNIFEFLLPFMYMFAGYRVKGVGLDIVLLALFALMTIIKCGFKFKIAKYNRGFCILLTYALLKSIVITLMDVNAFSQSFHALLSLGAYSAVFLILSMREFSLEKFYKGLKISGTVYTIGLLYHVFCIYILGKQVTAISIIPGYLVASGRYLSRPFSFFSEPAALALAMLPLLFFSLKKKEYIWSVIALVSIFLSTSTTGIVLAITLFVLVFVFEGEKKELVKKLFVLCVFIVIGICIVRSSAGIESLAHISTRLNGGDSTGTRVQQGLELVATMRPIEYIFGCLFNSPLDYVSNNLYLFEAESITRHVVVTDTALYFVNTFGMLIYKYGIVGALLYYGVLIRMVMEKQYSGKALAIIVMIETLGSSITFNAEYFILMLILIYVGKDTGWFKESKRGICCNSGVINESFSH